MKPFSSSELRRRIVDAALLGWRKREGIHYTQSSLRWQGIGEGILPPRVPSYADCSSFATWTYFAAGAPDPNGYGYDPGAAWTGTLGVHGISLGSNRAAQLRRARPGDLVFYGSGLPWQHVAIYIGGGEVVSHGGESGPLRLPIDYRPDRGDIRSYL
jgi:cell wall-associated NlpC family hydrolase